MGYLFLGLANICGAVKGYCGKMVSSSIKKSSDAMLANFLRMLLCSFIGLALVLITGGGSGFNIGASGVWISLLSGVSNSVFVISWLFAVNFGAYMLVSVFLTVGLLVPIALCAIFFGERIEWNHLVGFAVLIAAVLVMCSYSSSVKSKLGKKAIVLLFICGTSSGLASFSQKWFVYTTNGGSIPAFNFYTYVFASIVLLTSYLIFRDKKKSENSEKFTLRPVWHYVTIMAVMLFSNSYLMTLAASKLDAVLLYPLSTGIGLVLSALMCSIFFKEKLSLRGWISVTLACVGTCFFV